MRHLNPTVLFALWVVGVIGGVSTGCNSSGDPVDVGQSALASTDAQTADLSPTKVVVKTPDTPVAALDFTPPASYSTDVRKSEPASEKGMKSLKG